MLTSSIFLFMASCAALWGLLAARRTTGRSIRLVPIARAAATFMVIEGSAA